LAQAGMAASCEEIAKADAMAAEEELAALSLEDEAGELADETYGWDVVQESLHRNADVRRSLFHDLFQEKYPVTSSVDALVHAPTFLEEYLVADMDYRAFVEASGLLDEGFSEEDFTLYERQNLVDDLAVGVSATLEMVTKVALSMNLPMNEVMATMPGGSAVRVIPKCAALHRWLPGGLCTARGLRAQLPVIYAGPNPFCDSSADGLLPSESPLVETARGSFGERFHMQWEDIAVATSQDAEGIASVKSCCQGTMRVSFNSNAGEVSIISLLPVDLTAEAPADDLPRTQFTNEGPDVLLEVEAELGALFEEGMLIEADWFELTNGPWFLLNVSRIQSGLLQTADAEELAEFEAADAAATADAEAEAAAQADAEYDSLAVASTAASDQ